MRYSLQTRLFVGAIFGLALFGFACGSTLLLNVPPGEWVTSAIKDQTDDQTDEPRTSPIPTDAYVVATERLWIGPHNADYVLLMVWSDGQIWSAHSDQIDLWEPLTTVRKD